MNQNSISVFNPESPITMTSLELVDFINHERKEGDAELRHSDFLEKVPKVLGLEMSGNFRSSYLDKMNREKPCYNFPKREACLMAMSYSYELQAKVFDRMTALENKLQELPPAAKPKIRKPREASDVRDLMYLGRELLKMKGVQPALAMACTFDAIQEATGLPARMLTKALPAAEVENGAIFPVKQIGEMLGGLSSEAVNKKLCDLGFIHKPAKEWLLTESGEEFGEMRPFNKNGHSGLQIFWKKAVLVKLDPSTQKISNQINSLKD